MAIMTDLRHCLSTFMRCDPFTWFQCCTARKNHPEQISSDFGFHAFSYGELEVATEYFASSRILGKGSFGIVYHGELQDGRQIAVKFFRQNKHKKVQQFMNEIEVLSKLSHQNLVPFYGYCHHGHELMMVYQYIPNGTLADHLHGKRKKHGALPWHNRLNIAIEAASALAYLHNSGIIHRDVKSANILLDKKFCVKVADFGLSRTLPLDVSTSSQGAAAFVSHASTAPQGTFGYIDPDYFQYYRVSDKSDTYSFGVVLSEIISSSKAVDMGRNPYEENLSSLTINKIQNQALHELVDPCLGFQSDNENRHAITAVAELAFQCLQCPKELRPSMKQVLETLHGIKQGTWGFHQIT